MTVPVVVAHGAFAYGSGPIAPELPLGWAEGDIFVLPLLTYSGAAITVAGWTEAGNSPADTIGCRVTVFWKRATSSEAAPTTSDSGAFQMGRITAVRGCKDSGDPFSVTNNGLSSAGSVATITGATTVDNDCLVLMVLGARSDSTDDVLSVFSFENADLTGITPQYSENWPRLSHFGTLNTLLAFATGSLAVAGAYGDTSVSLNLEADYIGWTGALAPGTMPGSSSGSESDEGSGSDEGSSSEENVPEVAPDETYAFDTWQFDTPEPVEADRDPVAWYLLWQVMDNGAESRCKQTTFFRVTAKTTNGRLQIHGTGPDGDLDRDAIAAGENPLSEQEIADTSTMHRHKRQPLRVRNLSLWAPRISGEWDGVGNKDRLDELVIEGRPHGRAK